MNSTKRLWSRPKSCNSEPVLGCFSPFAPGEMLPVPNLCVGKFSLSFLLCAGWKRLVMSRLKLGNISMDIALSSPDEL